MSSAYQGWISELFEGMPEERQQQLYELLGELKIAGLSGTQPDARAPH